MKTPDSVRVLALLDNLSRQFGPQTFGQLMQRMLAASFECAGYTVTLNAVGVPDFTATKQSPDTGFSVEVKTTAGGKVSLSQRDLDGVLNSGHTPVIAVLDYPSFDPRWLFLDARAIKPGAFEIFRLKRRPMATMDFDANLMFRSFLGQCPTSAMEGKERLEDAIQTVVRRR